MKKINIYIDEIVYEKLKKEATNLQKSISELIRKKLENEEKIEKTTLKISKEIEEKISNKIEENIEKLISIVLGIIGDVDLKKIEEITKLSLFYSVFSALFVGLKFQSVKSLSEKEWQKLQDIKNDFYKKADEICQNVSGESVLEKLNFLENKEGINAKR